MLSDEEKLFIIKRLMRTVLLCPNGVNNSYRPIKGTTRQQCMNVLGQIQDLLETNKFVLEV